MTWPQSKRENPDVLVIEHRSRGVQKMMGTRRVICDSSHSLRAGSVVRYSGGRYGSTHSPLGFCSCRSGQALASISTIIRACPPHTDVRDVLRLLKRSERKLAPMTVSSPNVIEIKLDRLIDEMRLLRSQMIAFDMHLKGIEASLKPSEQQPESKSRPWFAAAVSATARTVLILFAVGAATGAALLYLGT